MPIDVDKFKKIAQIPRKPTLFMFPCICESNIGVTKNRRVVLCGCGRQWVANKNFSFVAYTENHTSWQYAIVKEVETNVLPR